MQLSYLADIEEDRTVPHPDVWVLTIVSEDVNSIMLEEKSSPRGPPPAGMITVSRLKKSNSLFTEAQGKLQWIVPFFDFLVFFLWSHPSNGSPKGKISLTGFSIK